MPFLRANIDRAIVMTQYDLRGFSHPLGFRGSSPPGAKSLDAITGNLISFAVNAGGDGGSTDSSYVRYMDSETTFEGSLAMCEQLVSDCDLSAKEAIQLIVQEIVRQSEKMKAEVEDGTMEPSAYLKPLEKSNRWGMTILALMEAFEVSTEEVVDESST